MIWVLVGILYFLVGAIFCGFMLIFSDVPHDQLVIIGLTLLLFWPLVFLMFIGACLFYLICMIFNRS